MPQDSTFFLLFCFCFCFLLQLSVNGSVVLGLGKDLLPLFLSWSASLGFSVLANFPQQACISPGRFILDHKLIKRIILLASSVFQFCFVFLSVSSPSGCFSAFFLRWVPVHESFYQMCVVQVPQYPWLALCNTAVASFFF